MTSIEEMLELLPFVVHDAAATPYYFSLDKSAGVYHACYEEYETGRNLVSCTDENPAVAISKVLEYIATSNRTHYGFEILQP